MEIQQHKQTITLDTRETKLIDLFRTAEIQIETANLPIGDIILKHTIDFNSDDNNVKTTTEYLARQITYEFIIERKCTQDMIASIKDGRYKEQKIRLLAESKNTNHNRNIIIAYIIEGTPAELRTPIEKRMLLGSLISSTFRDKIAILQTYSLQETFDLLVRMNDRLGKDYSEFFTARNEEHAPASSCIENISNISNNTHLDNCIPKDSNYLASIKKNKKDNMTPAMWNMNCLCGIPGVSSTIAIKIAEKYPTLRALLDAYQACTETTKQETLLADIILTETDKQRRRIGNVISKRIYEYFHL
jgi:crossover junction endonuclease MUS81